MPVPRHRRSLQRENQLLVRCPSPLHCRLRYWEHLVDKWLHHSVLTRLSGRLNFIDVVGTFSFLFVCLFFFLKAVSLCNLGYSRTLCRLGWPRPQCWDERCAPSGPPSFTQLAPVLLCQLRYSSESNSDDRKMKRQRPQKREAASPFSFLNFKRKDNQMKYI